MNAQKVFKDAEKIADRYNRRGERTGTVAGGATGLAVGSIPTLTVAIARHKRKKAGQKVRPLSKRTKAALITLPVASALGGIAVNRAIGQMDDYHRQTTDDIAEALGEKRMYTKTDLDIRDDWNRKHGEKHGYIPTAVYDKNGQRVAEAVDYLMEKFATLDEGKQQADKSMANKGVRTGIGAAVGAGIGLARSKADIIELANKIRKEKKFSASKAFDIAKNVAVGGGIGAGAGMLSALDVNERLLKTKAAINNRDTKASSKKPKPQQEGIEGKGDDGEHEYVGTFTVKSKRKK